MDKDDDDDSGYSRVQEFFLAKRRREYEMVGEL
jgi:hypothetical protein